MWQCCGPKMVYTLCLVVEIVPVRNVGGVALRVDERKVEQVPVGDIYMQGLSNHRVAKHVY